MIETETDRAVWPRLGFEGVVRGNFALLPLSLLRLGGLDLAKAANSTAWPLKRLRVLVQRLCKTPSRLPSLLFAYSLLVLASIQYPSKRPSLAKSPPKSRLGSALLCPLTGIARRRGHVKTND